MDQLSVKLSASNIGGDIGGVLVKYLCYADDICVIVTTDQLHLRP